MTMDINHYIYGISSYWRPYKIAWHLNKILDIDIRKNKDIDLDQNKNDEIIYISNFSYEAENFSFKLFENKVFDANNNTKSSLIKKYKSLDYIIIFDKENIPFELEMFNKSIRELKGIAYITKIQDQIFLNETQCPIEI